MRRLCYNPLQIGDNVLIKYPDEKAAIAEAMKGAVKIAIAANGHKFLN